jgi:uncharacterized membrane protein (UPF0127 family)
MRIFAVAFLLALWFPQAAVGLPIETIAIQTRAQLQLLRVEVAADPTSRSKGLMGRKHLAANAGMLFDFRKPMMAGFWMKGTPLPLDMLFVRADGTISTVAANAVPFSQNEIDSVEPVRAVIEILGGRAHALGIEPGDVVHARAFGNPVRR